MPTIREGYNEAGIPTTTVQTGPTEGKLVPGANTGAGLSINPTEKDVDGVVFVEGSLNKLMYSSLYTEMGGNGIFMQQDAISLGLSTKCEFQFSDDLKDLNLYPGLTFSWGHGQALTTFQEAYSKSLSLYVTTGISRQSIGNNENTHSGWFFTVGTLTFFNNDKVKIGGEVMTVVDKDGLALTPTLTLSL